MSYRAEGLIAERFRRQPGGPVVSLNEGQILRYIRLQPGVARSLLSDRFDLAQQSVHRIVDGLAERGLLKLGLPQPGLGRGQPSPSLWVEPAFAYTWGISLNTDDIGLCLMRFDGTPIHQEFVEIDGRGREDSIDMISDRMGALRQEHHLEEERCLGVGFGIAGYWVSGTQFNAPLPLHDWSLIELGPLLSARFGLPVWIENGANTASIGEAMLGYGRFISNFAYISFNYGLGGGLIYRGELLVGGNHNAGEFSGIYDREVHQRRPALQFLLARLIENGVPVRSISDISQHYDPKWPGAEEWIGEVAPAFNQMVNAIWGTFDPQAIVLGGQIPAKLAERFIQGCVIEQGSRYGVPRAVPKLMVSELGSNASALGAAAYPLRVCGL